jgi:hypothetical protein
MTHTDDPPAGRVAVFGDVGGQAAELRRALVALGADAGTLELPPDLTVVQVGDLIHRGPDSPGAVGIARTVMTAQPRQWVQLVGNHEAQYLAPPRFHWPERLPPDVTETVFEWWRTRRMRVAVAIGTDDGHEYLVTHAGLTEGYWRHFVGMPATAALAARALNSMIGRLHESWLFRPGVMVTGAVDLSAGPLWASAPDELLPSWLASSASAPFDQIHGHSSTVDWVTRREYGRPELAQLITEDARRRHATALVEGRRIIGIDPGHGRRPAATWAPLVLKGARML